MLKLIVVEFNRFALISIQIYPQIPQYGSAYLLTGYREYLWKCS